MPTPITFAVPKGRILKELAPLLARAGIIPEPEFSDENSRKLMFSTSDPEINLIAVRSFDAASFVAFGGAALGVAGSDVLEEFGHDGLYAPLDLGIGKCRLSVAEPANAVPEDMARLSHIRVATKYPRTAARYFAGRGIQAECIKLNGAMELAPKLGLARRIVDLVSTGKTLKENGLHEIATIAQVTSKLIVSRGAYKTDTRVARAVERLREVAHA